MEGYEQFLSNLLEKESRKVYEENRDENGVLTMNHETLRMCALENEGYEQPALNSKLYAHYKGFARIQNLGDRSSCSSLV